MIKISAAYLQVKRETIVYFLNIDLEKSDRMSL